MGSSQEQGCGVQLFTGPWALQKLGVWSWWTQLASEASPCLRRTGFTFKPPLMSLSMENGGVVDYGDL